jgi:hypothetical protein
MRRPAFSKVVEAAFSIARQTVGPNVEISATQRKLQVASVSGHDNAEPDRQMLEFSKSGTP